MIRKATIVTGLDISSSKVSAVALEIPEGALPAVLAYESHPSKGVSRGAFTDIAEASNSVTRVLTRLGEKIGRRPDNIYANISGETVKGERSRGMIPLSSRGREVTKSDMAKSINAASTIRLTFDRDIIHRIVLNYSIDDQPAIRNPLGLYASRLSCEMYMLTANLNHMQNIYKCVNDAGYDLKDVVYSGIADGISLFEDEWKEAGVMLIDMGSSLTENSIFSGGSLSSLDIIPIGGDDIRGDLKDSAAFNDMALRIKTRADDFMKKGVNIKSVVATGGFTFTEGVVEALEEKLSIPVKMGAVRNLQGNISSIDGLRAVTAIGLARYGAAQYQPKIMQAKNLVQDISNRLVEIFNNYF